jgi:Putative auto-transporter adhesin, head GIN domain
MIGRTALLIGPLLVLGLAGCELRVGPADVVQGSGNVKSEVREVQGFDRVEVVGVGSLTIAQGATEALSVQAEDNLLPRLQSTVEHGTLTLAPRPGTQITPTRPIRYDLKVRQLRAIGLSGAPDATAAGLNAGQLDLDVSGAGRMNLTQVSASSLSVHISGAAAVTVSGQAPQQTVSISGAGRYSAADLASQQATIDISGAGNCAVRVSDHLSVTISGAGHVAYTGSPTVEQHVSGAGSVTKTG